MCGIVTSLSSDHSNRSITPAIIVGLIGSVGAIFLAFRFAEWVKNRDKPYLASVIDENYAGFATYQKLQNLLTRATGDISFWGTRAIYVEGYRGNFSIEQFWERLDRLSYRENPQFSLKERLAGLSLVARINQLDVDADRKLPTKWFWTRGLTRFLEWNPSGARDIGEYYNRHYATYTKEQYQEHFGEEPTFKHNSVKEGIPAWELPDWEIKAITNNKTESTKEGQ